MTKPAIPESNSPVSGDIDSPELLKHVDAIRSLGKQTIENMIKISEHLTACKKIVGHGNFGDFLKREFAWHENTALNYMRVFELSKSTTVVDLNLPIKSLYLLAAPSTPETVRDEIISHASKGEKVKHAAVVAVVKVAKVKAANPTKPTGKVEPKANGAAAPTIAPAATAAFIPRTIVAKVSTVTSEPVRVQATPVNAVTSEAVTASDLGNENHRLGMQKISLTDEVKTLEDKRDALTVEVKALEDKREKLTIPSSRAMPGGIGPLLPADVKEPIPLPDAIAALIWESKHVASFENLPEGVVFGRGDLDEAISKLRRLNLSKSMAGRRNAAKALAAKEKAAAKNSESV